MARYQPDADDPTEFEAGLLRFSTEALACR